MKRLVLAAFLLASAPAFAGSYNDFSQGMTAFTEGRSMSTVIAAFSRALATGDLAPGLKPTAYLDRGIAYLRTGQCALALADFTAVAGADPSGLAYYYIGRAYWAMGNFASANNAFQKALKLSPQQPYYLLWLGISRLHNKNFNAQAFADHASDMSGDDWPLPVFRLFLGKITIAELASEAAKGDEKFVSGHKCEADFYGGEWQLTHGNVDAGKALFQDAVAICPKNFTERAPAQLELKRLQ